MKKLLIVSALIMMTSHSLSASEGAAAFLEAAFHPGSVAVGNADTAISKGALAPLSNSSGLINGTKTEIAASAYTYLGTNFISALASKSFGKVAIGAGYINSSIEGFEETIKSDRVTKTGNTFDYTAQAFLLSGALQIKPDWTVGTSIKYITEKSGDSNAAGFGIDIGSQLKLTPWLSTGINIFNAVQPSLKWDYSSTSDQGRRIYSLGLGLSPSPKWLLTTDIQANSQTNWIEAGITYKLHPALTLRAGVNNQEWSTGLGLQLIGIKTTF